MEDVGKPANGLGVAGVAIGAIGVLVCWIPVVNLMVVPLAAVGGILAAIGLVISTSNARTGPGWPAGGVVANVVALGGMVLFNTLFYRTLTTFARDVAEANAAAPVTPGGPPQPSPSPPTPAGTTASPDGIPADPPPAPPTPEELRRMAYGRLMAARQAAVAEADLQFPHFATATQGGSYLDRRAEAVESIAKEKSLAIRRELGVQPEDVPGILEQGARENWPVAPVVVVPVRPGDVRGTPPIPTPPAPEPAVDPDPVPPDDGEADRLLNFARLHDRDGRVKQAVENYRKVADFFPRTAAGKAAKERLRVLAPR